MVPSRRVTTGQQQPLLAMKIDEDRSLEAGLLVGGFWWDVFLSESDSRRILFSSVTFSIGSMSNMLIIVRYLFHMSLVRILRRFRKNAESQSTSESVAAARTRLHMGWFQEWISRHCWV